MQEYQTPVSGPIRFSPTIQEYLGTRYYRSKRDGKYRSNDGRQLHRVIYSHVFGNIPHGWQVHHKDRDQQNNSLDNLQALAPLDHWNEHRDLHLISLDQGRRKERHPSVPYTCQWCGKQGVTAYRGTRLWCSRACTNAAWRDRHG
jgi:hypothetical protein